MQIFDDEFSNLLNNLNLDKSKLYHQKNKYILEKYWEEIIGNSLYYHSRPVSIEKESLVIIVGSPAYKMEIQFIAKLILMNANKYLNISKLTKVNCKVGNFTPLKNIPKKKEGSLEGKEELLKIISNEKDQ